ncbi:hypothetical protein C8F04DRAFT_1252905 [Mycena alexandri]|uniref:Uncharacterized protein n=1 Tax=Mycena alexandri TaxID=1745969 RepID=A0AAD6X773_9AGAR|nr:hypothetical protein C8F04DRAFT_1252905 [Mycena alexandri]
MDSSIPVPGPNANLGEYAPPRRPEHNSAIYGQRNESGLYDAVADQILAMGTDALANIDYNKDYTRHVEDWSKNHRFMDGSGNELRTSIVGEILGPAMGTLIRAHGNYFARDGDDFKPIDDKSKIKDTLALGTPTQTSTKLHNTFLNQIIGANQVVTANANEDAANGRHPIVKPWSKAGIEGSPTHNVMMVTMLPKYGVPAGAGGPPSRAETTAKRRLDQVDDEVAPTPSLSSGKPEYTDEHVKLGAYYDPSVLPDYGGSYFNHSKARLVQLDVRDVKNNLIPPWKFYEALRPGTLVLCLVSLHCFTMSDDSGKDRKERKVYQMNAHSIRILSESDEYVEQRTRPIAPNSPERAIAAIPRRAVAASFANFTVPALPTVPPASPDLPDLPALPASPAHSPLRLRRFELVSGRHD